MLLKGKTIAVTGAASGIGAECASTMRSMGATIIAIDLVDPAEGVCDVFLRGDLARNDSISSVAHSLDTGIDALCNVAGLPPTKRGTEVLKVNFVGLRLLTAALISKLNGGGSIVNLASLAGSAWQDNLDQVKALLQVERLEDVEAYCDRHGVDDNRAYFLSKEALLAWTYQSRWRWKNPDIRMNAVSPGPVETPIHQDFLQKLGSRAEEGVRLAGRAGQPKDIAPLVAFLCSDQSRWIRGANIPCDGGLAAHKLCLSAGIN